MSAFKSIGKIIFYISLFFMPIILFLMLMRLNVGNSAFIGLSDVLGWFEQQDFYKPFKDLVDYITAYQNGVDSTFASIGNGANMWEEIANFFKAFGMIIGYLSYPVVILFNFIKAIVTYIIMFFDFLNYCAYL